MADALLIVFSVLLALILNEVRNNWQERKQTRQLVENLRKELVNNKHLLLEQYQYHLSVIHNIDSALTHESYRNQLFINDEFQLHMLGKEGIGLADFDQTAWEVAKSNNIMSKLDVTTMSLLNNIARQHLRIEKIEDGVASVLLIQGARKKENQRESLILMKDNYYGWAVKRVPGLLNTYNLAIKKLDTYLQ